MQKAIRLRRMAFLFSGDALKIYFHKQTQENKNRCVAAAFALSRRVGEITAGNLSGSTEQKPLIIRGAFLFIGEEALNSIIEFYEHAWSCV